MKNSKRISWKIHHPLLKFDKFLRRNEKNFYVQSCFFCYPLWSRLSRSIALLQASKNQNLASILGHAIIHSRLAGDGNCSSPEIVFWLKIILKEASHLWSSQIPLSQLLVFCLVVRSALRIKYLNGKFLSEVFSSWAPNPAMNYAQPPARWKVGQESFKRFRIMVFALRHYVYVGQMDFWVQ